MTVCGITRVECELIWPRWRNRRRLLYAWGVTSCRRRVRLRNPELYPTVRPDRRRIRSITWQNINVRGPIVLRVKSEMINAINHTPDSLALDVDRGPSVGKVRWCVVLSHTSQCSAFSRIRGRPVMRCGFFESRRARRQVLGDYETMPGLKPETPAADCHEPCRAHSNRNAGRTKALHESGGH